MGKAADQKAVNQCAQQCSKADTDKNTEPKETERENNSYQHADNIICRFKTVYFNPELGGYQFDEEFIGFGGQVSVEKKGNTCGTEKNSRYVKYDPYCKMRMRNQPDQNHTTVQNKTV